MDIANFSPNSPPAEKRAAYSSILRETSESDIPFAVGGSLAVSSYSGILRPVKDLDLYVTPEDKDQVISLLNRQGFEDYFDRVPYDRGWIYRAVLDDLIVDVIWQMANRRACVDDHWLNRGPLVEFEGVSVRLLPVEEMVWNRLYVLQRDRCDWPDVFNLLDSAWHKIDWLYLKNRLEDDLPLLKALMNVYTWLRPEMIPRVPKWALDWEEGKSASTAEDFAATRARLLDSRPWLVATAREDKPEKC
jgi:Uncharacterised nucleotidyltransferase